MKITTTNELSVDTTRGDQLSINVRIETMASYFTFATVACLM